MSRLRRSALLGLLLTSAGEAAAAGAARTVAPEDVVREVRRIVHRDFYAPQSLAAFVQLEKRRAQPEPGTKRRLDAGAAASASIDPLLESLKASHSARYTPDQLEYYELMDIFAPTLADHVQRMFPATGKVTFAGIGIAAKRIDGRAFVAYVYDGAPADRAGLELGDELIGVGSEPFTPIAAFAGKVGQTVDVRVRRQQNGPIRTVSVPVAAIQPTQLLEQSIRDSVRVFERGGRRYGYLRLWAFAGDGFRAVIQNALASEPLASADGLVLDLRGRWGGAPPDAGELFIGRTPSMSLLGRDGKALHVNVRWRAPLVAVIDGGTRSGMEVLAYSLRQAGVPLVGDTTAGAVLGGRPYVLGDQSLLLLAVMDVVVDGKRLEGVGVAPTVEVPFDLRYAAGRDPQLERALGELARRVPPARTSPAAP